MGRPLRSFSGFVPADIDYLHRKFHDVVLRWVHAGYPSGNRRGTISRRRDDDAYGQDAEGGETAEQLADRPLLEPLQDVAGRKYERRRGEKGRDGDP